jgi:hypothetical protein
MQSPYNLHVLLRTPIDAGPMRKFIRTLIIGVLALFALGYLSACSSGTSTESSPAPASPSTAAAPTAFPPSGRYMADMEADGKKMAIGISVDGKQITAYACNGVDDEAWFFGNQANGAIDITSKFKDTLSASFNGTDVTGDLDGVRASWIVRPDGSVTGVQFNGGITGRDFEQAELQQLNAAQFQSQVRNKRILQQAGQVENIQNGTLTSKINGRNVTGKIVTGNTRF